MTRTHGAPDPDEHREAFGARPFIAGTVVGIRSWRFCYGHDADELLPAACPVPPPGLGQLVSQTQAYAWTAGVNEAACTPTWHDDDEVHTTVGGAGCTCGFYAYFDQRNPHVTGAVGDVVGIVAGYGVATVGRYGFRAARAHIVALVRPAWAKWLEDPEQVRLLDVTLAALGVPVYASLELALQAHPLTRPVEDLGLEPAPDDDPNPYGHVRDDFRVMRNGLAPASSSSNYNPLGGVVSWSVAASMQIDDEVLKALFSGAWATPRPAVINLPAPVPFTVSPAESVAALQAIAAVAQTSLSEAAGAISTAMKGVTIRGSISDEVADALAKLGPVPAQPTAASQAARLGNGVTSSALDEWSTKEQQSPGQAATEARQRAGLRGVGGFDKRGRRRR